MSIKRVKNISLNDVTPVAYDYAESDITDICDGILSRCRGNTDHGIITTILVNSSVSVQQTVAEIIGVESAYTNDIIIMHMCDPDHDDCSLFRVFAIDNVMSRAIGKMVNERYREYMTAVESNRNNDMRWLCSYRIKLIDTFENVRSQEELSSFYRSNYEMSFVRFVNNWFANHRERVIRVNKEYVNLGDSLPYTYDSDGMPV